MTLIQRQDRITRAIENLLRKFDGYAKSPRMARPMRLLMEFNTKRMKFAGYTEKEAKASFRQCRETAELNVRFERDFKVAAA